MPRTGAQNPKINPSPRAVHQMHRHAPKRWANGRQHWQWLHHFHRQRWHPPPYRASTPLTLSVSHQKLHQPMFNSKKLSVLLPFLLLLFACGDTKSTWSKPERSNDQKSVSTGTLGLGITRLQDGKHVIALGSSGSLYAAASNSEAQLDVESTGFPVGVWTLKKHTNVISLPIAQLGPTGTDVLFDVDHPALWSMIESPGCFSLVASYGSPGGSVQTKNYEICGADAAAKALR